MSKMPFSLSDNYWEDFNLQTEDIEFLYNHLLELEVPRNTQELLTALVGERLRREKLALEKSRKAFGEIYQPKGQYKANQGLIFPNQNWRPGRVTSVRPGYNPELGDFQVIQVAFEDGAQGEFAANLAVHSLNQPLETAGEDSSLDTRQILDDYGDLLTETLEEDLATNADFVRIAGNWFPRALLVDVNIGHLNLVEAVLDMAGGGPLATSTLIEQIGLSSAVNSQLLNFSLDLALQEDERFDEVGPAGEVLWFLHRLEPAEVREPPVCLRYPGFDYDRLVMTDPMLNLERDLDDELSPLSGKSTRPDSVDIRLIYPHWRSGTLPLSAQLRHLFPTAYEAPRIRFMLVDGDTGEKFPAWVVREKRYVFGLRDWYASKGLIPGSILHVQRGKKLGEVILKADTRRPSREWIRTVLVGSDGGVVFAMLKQLVSAPFDDRMAIAIPDIEALDQVWARPNRDHQPLERLVTNMVRELAKLNPQGHVHASELYAALNVVRRLPPAPILALLASHPGFVHVGDLHFRLADTDLMA